MKLSYKIIQKEPQNSFLTRRDTLPCLDTDWHFHEEIELIYFLKSRGTRYVGNSIGSFKEGEIYLIGSNLPHLFRNNKDYYGEELVNGAVDLIVVQFRHDFLGETFLNLPDNKVLKVLLENAKRGIRFTGDAVLEMKDTLMLLSENEGFSGLVDLLNVLNELIKSTQFEYLCEPGTGRYFKRTEKERMAKIINFLTQNFHNNINLNEIADLANMTPNAFCRFFKKRTQKSFTKYLNEIRIENACKLLIEGELQIGEVSYFSGFNSLTNFNRQFRNIMNETPTEFLAKFNK